MTNSVEPAVKLHNIRFSFEESADSFSMKLDFLELKKGEKVFLAGQSGSGKSTLLGLICGTLVPQEGNIHILEKDITKLSSSARDRVRADHFGIIFQLFNLLPYLSILENVLLPLNFSKSRKSAASRKSGNSTTEAYRLLDALGVDAKRIGQQTTSELSVGQQQRVAAARAFIGYPEIIVADEPTSSLDEGHQEKFMQLLFEEANRSGATLIMVSHDRRLAEHFDRVIELEDLCQIEPEIVN